MFYRYDWYCTNVALLLYGCLRPHLDCHEGQLDAEKSDDTRMRIPKHSLSTVKQYRRHFRKFVRNCRPKTAYWRLVVVVFTSLSYRRVTARRLKSVEILSAAAQLHEKSHLTRRIAPSSGIKNIAGRFFGLVRKRVTNGQTDRITIPKAALA